MEANPEKRKLFWIIGGCTALALFVCVFAFAMGTGGMLVANQAVSKLQGGKTAAIDLTAETAVLYDLQGRVEVAGDSGKWKPAELNQVITAGYQIRTGKLSSARLLFNDGSEAHIKAGSEVFIDELNANDRGKPRVIVMSQVAGESDHQVVSSKNSASRYEVVTPSGAGLAQGTAFQVIVTAQKTSYFYVTEGVVAVSAFKMTVLVNPGYMTFIYLGQPPAAPIQTVSIEGWVSQAGPEWTISGMTFSANDSTVLVGNPQVGDWVQITGRVDENSQYTADRVVFIRSAPVNRFSLTGTVEEMGEDLWVVNGQNIEVSAATEIDAVIQLNDVVYVNGVIEAGGILQASAIERIDQEAGLPFAITGIILSNEGSTWVVSSATIETDESTMITDGLQTGDIVVVKGRILPDGVWLAYEIALANNDENTFSYTGTLETIEPWRVAGIAFETREDTVIESDLEPGDLVRVEGIIDTDGLWIAARIERIETDATGTMVIIGTVLSTDPWVVSGMTFNLAPDVVIVDGIVVGQLVRVELALLPDGDWQAIRIEPIGDLVWFPGCMDVIATVISLTGNQLQLVNWPAVIVADSAIIEGPLPPGSIIRIRICFNESGVIQVTYIVIVHVGEVETPVIGEGGKVTVCHKPGGKKGGHSITISRSALPAHLGHGDYIGACR